MAKWVLSDEALALPSFLVLSSCTCLPCDYTLSFFPDHPSAYSLDFSYLRYFEPAPFQEPSRPIMGTYRDRL